MEDRSTRQHDAALQVSGEGITTGLGELTHHCTIHKRCCILPSCYEPPRGVQPRGTAHRGAIDPRHQQQGLVVLCQLNIVREMLRADNHGMGLTLRQGIFERTPKRMNSFPTSGLRADDSTTVQAVRGTLGSHGQLLNFHLIPGALHGLGRHLELRWVRFGHRQPGPRPHHAPVLPSQPEPPALQVDSEGEIVILVGLVVNALEQGVHRRLDKISGDHLRPVGEHKGPRHHKLCR
mmetsp:Transcript_13667/g.30606  ORF Transcript_13667/g.30606 Transcript_13667/m.30606 type:complete len:235 (+) Transcript_13667:3184-3888(+)